jgi:hypothetical protein
MEQTVKSSVLMFAFGIVAASATAASAGTVTFTWSPSGANPALNGGNVTADDVNILDYASTTIDPATDDFTETGALKITSFSLGGSGAAATGLNSTYSLYLTFTASGNEGGPIPTPGHTTSGEIASISYTLWGDPKGNPAFAVHNGSVSISNNTGAVALATGTGGGTLADFVTLTNTGSAFIPSPQVITSFVPCAGPGGVCTADESSFFISPPSFVELDLESSFTNTAGVVKLHTGLPSSYLNITGGGGNLDLVTTPEPTTLTLFGAGLLGLGMVRSRRK